MTKDELLELADRHQDRDACLPWHTGKKGRIWVNGKIELVSRLVLAANLGRKIAPGMLACHTCDNPPCFSPWHLYEGSHADNMRDMRVRRRSFGATQPERHRQNGIEAGKKNIWTKGEGNPRARLSETEAARIRSSAIPTKELARLYGVSRSTIQRIRSGKLWSAT